MRDTEASKTMKRMIMTLQWSTNPKTRSPGPLNGKGGEHSRGRGSHSC